jgi:predicted HTH domain antitoxin
MGLIRKELVMTTAQELVAARLYPSEADVFNDALRHLLRSRPDLRVGLAVYRYQQGELSLARAADVAGVSWPHMRDILREQGVAMALGSETSAEAADEVAALRDELDRQP